MQRFHNSPLLYKQPHLASSQLTGYLIVDPYTPITNTRQKCSKASMKKQPKSLQTTQGNVQLAKPMIYSLWQEQAIGVKNSRAKQTRQPEMKINKKRTLDSKKNKNKMKEFILETLLKAQKEGNCLVIQKGTAQPQMHCQFQAHPSKKNHQPTSQKERSTQLQLPRARLKGSNQRLKPRISSLIFPSIQSSKRLLMVARQLSAKREKRKKLIEQIKEPRIEQIEVIQEKLQIQEENEILEEIIEGSVKG